MTNRKGSLLMSVSVFVVIGSVLIMGLVQNFIWMRRGIEERYGALKVTYLAYSGLALSRQYFSMLPNITPIGDLKQFLYEHLQSMWKDDSKMDGDIFLCRNNDLIYIVAVTGNYRAAFQVQYTVGEGGVLDLSLADRL